MGHLSFWDVGALAELLQRWRVDDLCHLPGRQSVAQPCGWDRAAATHLPADAGSCASLVAGWEENCFYRHARRQAVEDLYGLCQWRRATSTDAGGAPRKRRVLVARWRHAGFFHHQY